MIKNRLKIAALTLALVGSSLSANPNGYEFDTVSLVGIEGGYTNVDYEREVSSTNSTPYSLNVANIGLKIGAETEDFRVFLSGRYFHDSGKDYEYITMYGAELQYKFNVTQMFNIYLGANAGIANLKFSASDETFSRTLSEPYFGGDLGTNIHLGDSVDLELGGRVMSLQATNTKAGVTYRINNLVSAYASIIFRWKMD